LVFTPCEGMKENYGEHMRFVGENSGGMSIPNHRYRHAHHGNSKKSMGAFDKALSFDGLRYNPNNSFGGRSADPSQAGFKPVSMNHSYNANPGSPISATGTAHHNKSSPTVDGPQQFQRRKHRHASLSATTGGMLSHSPVAPLDSPRAPFAKKQHGNGNNGIVNHGNVNGIRTSPTNYCGPKFTESPDPSCLPMPPVHWISAEEAFDTVDDVTKKDKPAVKKIVELAAGKCRASAGGSALCQLAPGTRLTGRQLIDLLNAKA
jgi:hypothetical protein